VGTFQFFAARRDVEATQRLADYVIERHYPAAADAADPYLELLRSVVRAQAFLVARWMSVGFIHGVMNTDNMAVSGETIDFGPCAFMDGYDPMTVFSSIDSQGRYAYGNQPAAAQWNLARFAETLLPLLDSNGDRAIEIATAEIAGFSGEFDAQWQSGMRRKLGLEREEAGDAALARELLELMQRSAADFTVTFRRLCDVAATDGAATDRAATEAAPAGAGEEAFLDLFDGSEAVRTWLAGWRSRMSREPQAAAGRAAAMRLANPAVIPRNHRIEQAIAAAVEAGDYTPFERLCDVLSRPYAESPSDAAFQLPPRPDERVLQTFCGT
jgi:uncharacterized protein YdiU (UPF0061 family)